MIHEFGEMLRAAYERDSRFYAKQKARLLREARRRRRAGWAAGQARAMRRRLSAWIGKR